MWGVGKGREGGERRAHVALHYRRIRTQENKSTWMLFMQETPTGRTLHEQHSHDCISTVSNKFCIYIYLYKKKYMHFCHFEVEFCIIASVCEYFLQCLRKKGCGGRA